MKREEKLAKDYLVSKNFKSIKFEPDGNIPPDFLVNNNIAIEVRRLNKHYKGIALEKVDYNIIPKIEKFIKSIKYENFDTTTIISIYYSRPIKFNSSLKVKIKKTLNNYLLKQEKKVNDIFYVSENLEFTFFELKEKWDSKFEVHAYVDLNRGGAVFEDICDNLEIIIEEKEKKINKIEKNYNNWWLLLIDFIGYGISNEMCERIKKRISRKTIFKKIVFISPLENDKNNEINF